MRSEPGPSATGGGGEDVGGPGSPELGSGVLADGVVLPGAASLSPSTEPEDAGMSSLALRARVRPLRLTTARIKIARFAAICADIEKVPWRERRTVGPVLAHRAVGLSTSRTTCAPDSAGRTRPLTSRTSAEDTLPVIWTDVRDPSRWAELRIIATAGDASPR